MEDVFFIEAETGCTCCCSEDHTRGPFKTKEEADRRIAYYLNPESPYAPLASQYAPQGRYRVRVATVEDISGDRVIVDESWVFGPEDFGYVTVQSDGTILLEGCLSIDEKERFVWP